MKQVSNNFKTYIKTNGKQLDCKIVITDDLILGKKDVNSIQLFFNTTLFKTVMCGLEIDSNTRIAEGTEFKAKIGVKFKNSAYEYIEYENYTVYKCERQEDTESYKITAYDKMLEAMVDFDMEVSQSLTTRQYLVSIFEWLNWDTTGIPATFVNSTKLIEPNIHTGIGYTFRDVLDEIATITGAFIYFNGDIPYLKYITDTVDYKIADGKNINFTSPIVEKIIIEKLEGSSTQTARSGKNLFNGTLKAGLFLASNGVTFVQNNNYVCSEKFVSVISGETYSVSNKNEIAGIYYVLEYDENKNFIKANNNSAIAASFTTMISSNCCYVRVEIGNSSAAPTVAAIEDFQIEKGPATEYEQYGTSPSPDYPSPIENITGDIEIKDVGENLFNPNNVSKGYVSDASGNILSISGQNKNTGYIEIIGGEKYYILSNKPIGNWGAWYDKDKKFISGITLGGNSSGIVTAPNNAYFINFTVSYENNNPDYANNVMIARSDKEIPYKPYQAQKVTFPLGNQKLMEGSYLADNGIHHTRKQTTVNISNLVTLSNGNKGGVFSPSRKKSSVNNGLLCTKAREDKTIGFITGTFYENPASVVFVGDTNDTLETLKAKYDGAILEYALAKEEIIPYTTEQQIALNLFKTLVGENNIEFPTNAVIKYPLQSTIDEMYLSQDDVTIGKKYFINSLVFSRAEESDSIYRKDNESITQKGLSEFKISDNQILSTNNRADFIDELWNYLKNLEFYTFDVKSTGIMWYDVADKFIIKAHNNTYPVVLLNDETTVDQDIEEHLYADEPKESETDYKCASYTDKKINQTNLRVDKQNQKIEGLITQIGDRSEKTTSITADIDGLSSKVSNIQDLTQTTIGNKTIILNECAKGELLELHIFGNNTVFNYQVLSNDLVFSDNLILGKDKSILVITNEDNSSIEYDLKVPGVLRKNEDIRDEYVIQNGVAKVIRRINDDGTVKDTEVEENIGELKILLDEGTNTVEIKDFNAEMKVKWAIKSDFTDVFTTKVEMSSTIEQTAGQIMTEVNKKVDNAEIGTKITQNYESVQIAWNSISEFIKFLNAMLQILDKNKKLLMSLDKTGMHFFNSGKEIGNIGINNAEVSFYINGDVSGSSMSWGINKTINGEMKYFPVFSYSGYNTDSGTEFGGKFLLEAPLIMQEKTLFLGQDMNSSYIQGQETDNRKKTTIGNTDDFYIYNSAGNLILVLNSSYLKLYEQLEMYADPLAAGGYDFNFKDNSLIGIDRISASGEISGNNGTFNDIANSDNIRRFNNTGTDYLIAVLKSSAGGGSIYCQNANSDKKFKKNIKDAEISAVDTIMKIRHRQYDWKSNGKHEYVGYIAQELEKVNPNLVSVIKENSEETYLLNEKALIATATKAIQEQQKIIEQLQTKVKEMEVKLDGKD